MKKLICMIMMCLVLLNSSFAMLKISSDSEGNIIVESNQGVLTAQHIKSEGYVEAKDFIVHSEGFIESSNLREDIERIDNKEDGTIDKSTIDKRYIEEDGIKIWSFFLDTILNLAKDLYSKIDEILVRLDNLEKSVYVNHRE